MSHTDPLNWLKAAGRLIILAKSLWEYTSHLSTVWVQFVFDNANGVGCSYSGES
jgi:hypothetical protein